MAARVALARGLDREPRRAQRSRKLIGELRIEPADMDTSGAQASVNTQHDVRARCQGQALGMVEAMAGDVQVAVAPAGLQSLEAEQAINLPGDEPGDLRGARLDQAPVGRNDEHVRALGRAGPDPIIQARPLGGCELRERAVLAQSPSASSVRYAKTDGARNQGVR